MTVVVKCYTNCEGGGNFVCNMYTLRTTTRCGIITGPPSFNWHNLVNMQFIGTKITDNIAEEMLNLHV